LISGLQADTFLEATDIEKEKLSYGEVQHNNDTDLLIREMIGAGDPDVFSRLAGSIAPEIFGHEDVKKALLLQLVGGVTRYIKYCGFLADVGNV
jgi:DNA replication licensing factor MCM7